MAKKSSKHYPVVRHASIITKPGSISNNIKLLQVDQELSKLNRRLYRHGRYYQVKIDMDHAESATNYVVLALRDDWAVQKGFQIAYQQYLDNTLEERERMLAGQVSRWEDFRTDSGLTKQELVSSLWDETIAPVALDSGEFTLSRVVDDANTERTFTFKPVPAANEFGVLTEYDKMGNAQRSPSAGASTAYQGLTGEDNDATRQHLENAANDPPYVKDGVNAATPWVKIAELGATAGAQRLSTGYFTAPCGFVVIYSTEGNVGNLTFEVKSGDYKGVHAPSMIEVATVNRKRKVVK
uniref:Uncharacterized protein n=1 Tax=uncultured marine virus TaxID=186617 RepID=S4TDQ7_9VIRU|nr:hypothetical protein [uncultured marine virus]